MQPLERIKKLVRNLPDSDQLFAKQFIQDRDFSSLYELVDSAIYKARKEIRKNDPNPKYGNLDIDELCKLKAEVDVYMDGMKIVEEDNPCYEDFNMLGGEIDEY